MPHLFFFHNPFGGLIGLLWTIFWIWMLIDAVINPNLSGTEKLIWFLVIFFIPCLGALLYFFLGRRRRTI